MVRIGVYRGFEKSSETGLTLLNFDILNDLEETSSKVKDVQLQGRFNTWKEPLMEDRIYFINILPHEKGKPARDFEILDKCKFITHENNRFFISYRKYSGRDLIDFYEEGVSENRKHGNKYNDPSFNLCQEYINYCLTKKKGTRLHFNTFTKFILEKVFSNYGYDNVIHYKTKNEKSKWSKQITQKVKNFVNEKDTKNSDWSKKEIKFLIDNINKPEKYLAEKLDRTVPAIATMKWKVRNEDKSILKDLPKKEVTEEKPVEGESALIAKTIKDFRKKKGYNQRELSKLSGVSISVISQLECEVYISTNSQIVEDLLNYIDNEGGKVLTETVMESETDSNKGETPSSEELSETISKAKDLVGGDTTNMNFEYVLQLLSEIKFMNTQLLSIQKDLNDILSVDNNNNVANAKASVRLVSKLKELEIS
jgi:transcriptional regulator with XRE-family HTH domain